jgi:hypothetical protein
MLALRNACGTVACCGLRPCRDPVEAYPVLDGLSEYDDAKLGHRSRQIRHDFALPEFRNRQRHGFIEGIRPGLDGTGMAL